MVGKKRAVLPTGYPSWSAFNEVAELTRYRVKKIVKELDEKKPDERKIKLYHDAAMDQASRDARGAEPLKTILENVSAEKVRNALPNLLAWLKADVGVGGPIGLGVEPDAKNSTWTMLGIGQSGLGMPDRNYYLDKDKEGIQQNYTKLISKYFALAGKATGEVIENPQLIANKIMDLEKEIARVHMDKITRRDPSKTYNKMSVEKWQELCKCDQFQWADFLKALGKTAEEKDKLDEKWRLGDLNVGSPAALKDIIKILYHDPQTTSHYLKFHVINAYAQFDLSKDFLDAAFDFYGKTLSGLKEMKPLWKRALAKTEATFDEALGKLYVDRHFKPETKAKAQDMVKKIEESLSDTISKLHWMSEETKKQAQKKVDKMTVKIGYPDKWMDYSGQDVSESGDHFYNVQQARAFGFRYELTFANKPTDKSQWGMSPQTVNAYYSPPANEIVFPAGILQPPFFDAKADHSINFGGIGGVVGHELTHGFDDQGRRFDSDGNLNDWWTEKDAVNFEKISKLMVDQTNAFKIYDTSPQGELTNGENLADLGGLTLAYKAFTKELAERAKRADAMKKPVHMMSEVNETKPKEHFTPQQRFFFSWARNWAAVATKESVLMQMQTDPHPPSKLRANGPPSNFDAFYEAFDVKPEDGMYKHPSVRVLLWTENQQGTQSAEHYGSAAGTTIMTSMLALMVGLFLW